MRAFLCLLLFCAGWAQAQVKWEYATLESCSYTINSGSAEGYCTVVYATPEGAREEVVRLNEPAMQSQRDGQGRNLEIRVQQKTIAKLGEDGWELVAVVGAHPQADRRDRQYFFKRQKPVAATGRP